MRWFVLAALAGVASVGFAQTAPTPPAVATTQAPATQPAQSYLKVYVAPFSESGSVVRAGWLRDHLTNAVRNGLQDVNNVNVVEPAGDEPAKDSINQVYFDRAKSEGAQVAVIGAANVSDDNITVSGDLYDANRGVSYGNFKASGSSRDLFAIEDSLVKQVNMLAGKIAEPLPTQTTAQATRQANAQTAIDRGNYRGLEVSQSLSHYGDQPAHTVEQPDIQFLLPYAVGGYGYYGYGWPAYSLYNPYYGYYYYGSGYPYWNGGWWNGPSVVIINTGKHGFTTNTGSHTPPAGHVHTVPPEVATRNQNGSLVATPPSNQINNPPSNQINNPPSNTILHPPANTIQRVPSYEIRPTARQPANVPSTPPGVMPASPGASPNGAPSGRH